MDSSTRLPRTGRGQGPLITLPLVRLSGFHHSLFTHRQAVSSIQMEIAVVVAEADFGLEEVGQVGFGQDGGFGAVGEDASFAEQDDALDFGDDFGDVVRDQEDAQAGLHQFAHRFAQLQLRANVEGVAGLVEEERVRLVDQRAGNQRALGFAGGHLGHGARREVGDAEALERGLCSRQMHRIRMVMRENARAAEESGEHHVASCGIGGAGSEQVRRNDAQERAQFENVPALAAEDRNRGAVFCLIFGWRQRIALAGDRFDERGFAAAVWPQDADVLSRGDLQIYFTEGGVIAAHYRDVFELEKRRGHGVLSPRRPRKKTNRRPRFYKPKPGAPKKEGAF